VVCAKTAEPIQMPFGLGTRVGPRKHVVDVAQIPCTCEGAIIRGKDIPGQAWRHCRELCKNGPTDRVAVWTRVGEGSTSSITFAMVASMCPRMGGHIDATWRTRLNSPSAAAMRLMSNYFDHFWFQPDHMSLSVMFLPHSFFAPSARLQQ